VTAKIANQYFLRPFDGINDEADPLCAAAARICFLIWKLASDNVGLPARTFILALGFFMLPNLPTNKLKSCGIETGLV